LAADPSKFVIWSLRSNDLSRTKRVDSNCSPWIDTCERVNKTGEEMKAMKGINKAYNKLANQDAKKAIKAAIKEGDSIYEEKDE
jgi:hypothetical protein